MISSLTGFTWKQVAILQFKMAAVKVHFWGGTDPQILCLLLIWSMVMYQVSCFYHKMNDFFTYPPHYKYRILY